MPFIFSFNKNARFTNYKLEQLLRTSTKNNLTEIIFQDDLGTNHEKKRHKHLQEVPKTHPTEKICQFLGLELPYPATMGIL